MSDHSILKKKVRIKPCLQLCLVSMHRCHTIGCMRCLDRNAVPLYGKAAMCSTASKRCWRTIEHGSDDSHASSMVVSELQERVFNKSESSKLCCAIRVNFVFVTPPY